MDRPVIGAGWLGEQNDDGIAFIELVVTPLAVSGALGSDGESLEKLLGSSLENH